jgi:hypothetical protein
MAQNVAAFCIQIDILFAFPPFLFSRKMSTHHQNVDLQWCLESNCSRPASNCEGQTRQNGQFEYLPIVF